MNKPTDLTPTDLTIERLGHSDISSLKALNQVFADAFQEPEEYLSAPSSDARLRTLLSQDSILVLVAKKQNNVVAGLVSYVLERLERRRREIYVYDLAVQPSEQRQGIATALLNELRRWATRIDAQLLFIQSEQGDQPASQLYNKLGAKTPVLHFEMTPLPIPPQ